MKFTVYCLLAAGLVAGVISCSRNPYATTNKSYKKQAKAYAKTLGAMPVEQSFSDSAKLPPYWVGTTNFGMRKPNYVIIHHTAQNSCEQTLKTFTLPRTAVSAHYVICRTGTLHHMLNDYLRAWHAGNSKWGGSTDINSNSIGIELDNNGFEYFDSLQINSLISLLGRLKKEYGIPAANFIGHGDIAPTRKNDPNWRFPWKKLAEKGFGLWYDDVRDTVPAGFNHIQALRIIGYDVKDTTAAIQSFKRHFLQDTTKRINDLDKSVLYNLQKKYM
ncbi:N-acetylmuramoyl-L-alanine amidase [Sediminibacterium ginsengisoli]|uniref:N-acetylmuramoyl-L-alanine amidase n=1 Tax=Sediminibacterium ginsengisoli TaxID=413434 RepID=A0A1T4R2A0_9BACT|nr:N-acetylmuramoyl-L-alanine amidase [Sediminibacterium ginsengisoli]SKA10184.1 N-acetylmuramoyl-L-alanine amidase [Sediminibacterium ginsengisoli]